MLRHAIMGFAAVALVSATVIPDEALASWRGATRHRVARHGAYAGRATVETAKGDCYRAVAGLVCPRWPY
jgi:hypothetical protein